MQLTSKSFCLCLCLWLGGCVTYQPLAEGKLDRQAYAKVSLGRPFYAAVYLKSYNVDGNLAFCGSYIDGYSSKSNYQLFIRQTRIKSIQTGEIISDLEFLKYIPSPNSSSGNRNLTNCVVTDRAWDINYSVRKLRITRWYPLGA